MIVTGKDREIVGSEETQNLRKLYYQKFGHYFPPFNYDEYFWTDGQNYGGMAYRNLIKKCLDEEITFKELHLKRVVIPPGVIT